MHRITCAWIGVLAATGLGCALTGGDASPLAAEGDGISITLAELDTRAKEQLFDEETRGSDSRLYELRQRVLDEWIREQVLTREAERAGTDVPGMLETRAETVSDAEVAVFFQQNASRLPPGTEFATVEASIREHLARQKQEALVVSLVEAAKVETHLKPPRLDVAADGPSLGPENAPITVIEFSDFQCPYCARAVGLVKQLRERYPEQVRVVYRHLPLDSIHPRARAAAVASVCAEDQGRFWDYHDLVFESPQDMTDEALRGHAATLSLDLERFDACLADASKHARVEADVQAARDAGISGTPAFLVNGILLAGVQPIETFERIIENDLAGAAPEPSEAPANPAP